MSMKGSIVKRNDNYAIVIYLGRDSFGKKKQRWFSGYKTKNDAEKALPRLLVKLEDGDLIDNNNYTISSFAKEWLDNKIKSCDLSKTTIDGYENIVNNHIIPTIGSLSLQDVKPINIQKYINLKSEKLSRKTLNNHRRILKSMFIYAEDMELIYKNPMRKITIPRAGTEESTSYSLEESTLLLEKIQSKDSLKVPVTLAMLLGLRRGECLGLKWDDINFDSKKIHIRNNLQKVKGEIYLTTPKTKKSIRTLSAPQILMDYLVSIKKWQLEMTLRSCGTWINKDNLVCVNLKTGGPMTPNVVSDTFTRYLSKNNFRKIRFHDLRHTNATIMIALGTNSKVAMQRLGHSNISITLGLYSHVLEDMDIEVADKFNTVFSSGLAKGLAE